MAKTKARLIIAVVCIIGLAALGWSIHSTLAKQDYNGFGLAAYGEGNYDKAIEYYTKAIEVNPDDATGYYNRGLAYYGSWQWLRPIDDKESNRAIADFSKAIELDPKYIAAYYMRGAICSEFIHHYHKLPAGSFPVEIEDKYNRALADFNKVLQLDPSYVLAYVGRGNLFYRYYDGYPDMQKAIGEYNKALESQDLIVRQAGKEGLAAVYYSRGRAYTNLWEMDKAEADYLKAIELNPTLPIALGHLTHLYVQEGRYSAALELCQRYEEAAGGAGVHSLDFKGTSYYHLGEYDRAIEAFDELATSSHSPAATMKAYRYLGMIYRAKGNKGKAEAYFKEAVDSASRTITKGGEGTGIAVAYYQRGLAYAELNEYDNAISDLLSVIAAKAASDREYGHTNYYIEAHIGLGTVYSKIGQTEKACEYLETAKKLLERPGYPKFKIKEIQDLLNEL